MLLRVARLCRQLPPSMVRIVAENPGFSSNVRETRRETDCLLEGNGFELPVPRQTQAAVPSSAIRSMLLGEGTLQGFTLLQINVNKSLLKDAFKYGAVSVILSKREDISMIDYQTIIALVNQIPTDTWDVLKQIKEYRPAMMLSELIECGTRPAKRSEPRSPKSEPV